MDAGLAIEQLEFNVINVKSSDDYTLKPVFTMLSVSGGLVENRFYLTANIDNSLFDANLDGAVAAGDKDTLSRSDRSLTLGYYIKNNVSVFVGYLTGDTEDAYSSPLYNETGTISFTEKGPFAGANYLLYFSKGALSLNFAYALLKGESEVTYKIGPASDKTLYKGDTSGISLGAKYVGQWMQNINYYIGGKINLFKFDATSFNTKENFYIAQAGVTYKF